MSTISLILPDGSTLEVPRGTTGLQVAESIGSRLAKAALAVRLDGRIQDLERPLEESGEFAVYTFSDAEGQEVYRHSAAHVMAAAVLRLFREARPTIGPAIPDGFYYDFEMPRPFTEEDLERIEAEMHKLVKADLPFVRREVSVAEAREIFADNPYKLELIEELEAEGETVLSVYEMGEFTDLCRGPHVPSTGRIKAYKLTSMAAAYWRGDENRQSLQRLYGTAYPDPQALQEHLDRLEQARLRDHRKLGRELGLFTFFEQAGAGLPYYLPNGAMLRQTVCDFALQQHLRRGYQLLRTPHLIRSDIWETSGHAQQNYPMYYTDIEGQSYGIKPMNCPGHILIYNSQTHSYRDLPVRYFELGTVYRHERSGVLHGLLRVRGFTQDDAHIFCTPEQLTSELIGVLNFARDMLRTFGFSEFEVDLSTRPEKSMGSDENWEHATEALAAALQEAGLEYHVDEGEGAFYGPKIDIKLKDAIGRLHQGPTIQCDLNMPDRFDVNYVGEDGKEHRAVMIHRVVLAGIERFLGLLIEHYAGAFPIWLAPVQVRVLPITERALEYGRQVRDGLLQAGLRAELDDSQGTLSAKIRDAELLRLPYMLIVGDREAESGQVAVRHREEGDLGPQPLEDFLARLRDEAQPPRG
ncbi:MAG: threonine--tRNA ligase [candidate division WS1 bacterium]|nr:threonine--tRNA ligase [candidate division WS1 bacterium]